MLRNYYHISSAKGQNQLMKICLVIATNVYLKEACNNSSFNFMELDTG